MADGHLEVGASLDVEEQGCFKSLGDQHHVELIAETSRAEQLLALPLLGIHLEVATSIEAFVVALNNNSSRFLRHLGHHKFLEVEVVGSLALVLCEGLGLLLFFLHAGILIFFLSLFLRRD